MFKHLLVAYDFSPTSKKALEWGVCLSTHFESSLDILHVIAEITPILDPPALNLPPNIMDAIRAQVEEDLQGYLVNKGEEPSLQANIEVTWGIPGPEIVEVIRGKKPDLAILGARGQTGLDIIHLGSVVTQVIREASNPILVTRHEPVWPPQKVLLPVDFSPEMEKALQWTVNFCRAFKAQLDLVHVITIPEVATVLPDAATTFITPDFEKTVRKKAMSLLENFQKKFSDLTVTTHTSLGPIVDEISRRARSTKADLIIMPIHHHKGLGRLFLGSVTEQTVRYAPTNVLCLPL